MRKIYTYSYSVMALCVGAVILLGSYLHFAGAVIANGRVSVSTHSKVIKAATNGVVTRLLVSNDDRVIAGQVLVEIDDRDIIKKRDVKRQQLHRLLADRVRLEALLKQQENLTFDYNLVPWQTTAAEDAVVANELLLFNLSTEARREKRALSEERVKQLRLEIAAGTSTRSIYQKTLELAEQEYDVAATLLKGGLTTLQRLLELEREKVRFQGELSKLASADAQVLSRIAEEHETLSSEETRLLDAAAKELKEVNRGILQTNWELLETQSELEKYQVVASHAGYIHNLQIHGTGALLNIGDPLMAIIPTDDAFVVTAMLGPTSISQVYPGQKVILKPVERSIHMPETIDASIKGISPDTIKDEWSRTEAYSLTIVPKDGETLLDVPVGTPMQAFISTEERTILSYIMKPLTDQINKTFRD